MKLRKLIKENQYYKQSTEKKMELLNNFHQHLCKIYNLQYQSIFLVEDHPFIGSYNVLNHKIEINKPSIITYLHEFYHFKANIKRLKNSEELARGWSHSLFYRAAPKMYKQAKLTGKLLH